jgi:hypothetical protein
MTQETNVINGSDKEEMKEFARCFTYCKARTLTGNYEAAYELRRK